MLILTLLKGSVIDYEPHIGFGACGMRVKTKAGYGIAGSGSDLSSLTILSRDSRFSVQSHGLTTRQANLTINRGTS